MAYYRKFKLLLWKNWLFRKRSKFSTICAIILSTLLSWFLLYKVNQIDEDFGKYLHGFRIFDARHLHWKNATDDPDGSNDTDSFAENVTDATDSYNSGDGFEERYLPKNYTDDNKIIYYTPDSNISRDLLFHMTTTYLDIFAEFVPLKDEQSMSSLESPNLTNVLAGISFVDLENSLPTKLHYRIRMAKTLRKWNTDTLLVPNSEKESVLNDEYDYLFMMLQHLIAVRFIEVSSVVKDPLDKVEFYTQKFPHPPYHKKTAISDYLRLMLPFFIVVSFIFIFPTLIKNIVHEKETGIRELMKLMGLSTWLQWSAWFVSTFIMAMIAVIIMTILLSCDWFFLRTVLPKTAPELFLLILLLYIASSISFFLFFSTFFSKPTVAISCAVVIMLLTFLVTYFAFLYIKLSFTSKIIIFLLPNAALTWVLQLVIDFEISDVGLVWTNLSTPSTFGDKLTALSILWMFVFDIFFYLILAWYLDHILPSIYGIRKPWYFLFTKNYWCAAKFLRGNFGEESVDRPDDFEKEPVGLNPYVEIVHLTKRFGRSKIGSFLAVDNVSIKLYKGQITALLGHNGAGKTTIMSMLTGMYPPTSGTAYVNGYNIRSQMDAARRSLGLCPQRSMLFDSLTCKEHLQFFGGLKINSTYELNEQLEPLLIKLQLWRKQNTYPRELSGGMKRKLNLGIALIGRPKVVMLDEPTSGLDPEARRAIWDVIQEHRESCCIVMSTHLMDEADALADRIAIMANGQLVCCGSPNFLKTRFSAGYHLQLVKANKINVNKVAGLIDKHIKEAYITSNNSSEVSFVLPADQTQYFANFFREFELIMRGYGVADFGLSISTVEDVFLKVGDLSYYQDQGSGTTAVPAPARLHLHGELSDKNSGMKFRHKQIIGLLLKRWYYAKRRWSILIFQILLPPLIVCLGLKLGEIPYRQSAIEPPLVMNLAQYHSNTTFFNQQDELKSCYDLSIPSNCKVIVQLDPDEYLRRLATRDFRAYVEDVVVGAMITNTSTLKMTAWYNGLYYHTEPLSLNILHNALLKFYTNNINSELIVENAPFPATSITPTSSLLHVLMIAIYFPLGTSVFSSLFVIFPIHERATMCKQLQLMTGVGGILFWGVSFMWDFLIHMICSSILSLVIILFDNVKLFTGDDRIDRVFILLLLYGWSSIALSYLMSLATTFPATGFTRLVLLSILFGMVFSIVLFIASIEDEDKSSKTVFYGVLLCRFVPSFTITFALMKIGYIGSKRPKFCSGERIHSVKCLDLKYFKWDFPGINGDIFALSVTGILFFAVLAVCELDLFQRIWYICISRSTLPQFGVEFDDYEDLDSEVTQEKARIDEIVREGKEDKEVLLVADLTKRFRKLIAVRGLNFSVEGEECFGLIGVNGAGKTTTFQMLTGNLIISNGNAFIYGTSIKNNRSEYLKNIGYCPQVNPLIDYLTGEEMLTIFAYLRGIHGNVVKETLDRYIECFDLQNNAKKITRVYSAGSKRKLSVALAFIGDPQVVFLDEPTTGVDPISRRKIRDILSGANRSGKCVLLTSHNMEECEALCNRVGIMVNGQFRALGGIQYLKNKFSEGFVIFARMKRLEESKDDASKRQINLQRFIELQFPSARLTDVHQGLIEYQVYDKKTKWAYMFETMEKAKYRFNLEDYTVSQTSLDQVFLSFARE